MSKRKIYVSGKVTGLKAEDCARKFLAAEQMLKERGYEVINPVEIVATTWGADPVSWTEAMRVCIRELSAADEIYMLHDWQDSPGAMVERDIAIRLGIPVRYWWQNAPWGNEKDNNDAHLYAVSALKCTK